VEAKKEFPKDPVWVDSKKRLTESNKTSNVKNQIQRKLMQLYAIDKEKPTKKFMCRKRKATEKKGKEHHPISLRWFWNMLIDGEDNRRRFYEKALLLGLLQIRVIKR
jgi:hypothetical protein